MRHAVTRVSLGWTLLMIAILLLPRAAIAIPRINLEVTLRELPSNSIVLHIKLTNSGPDALSMYQEQLPWGTPYSTSVVIMRWDGRKGIPLSEFFPIADSLYRPVTIAPGQSLEGDYSLRLRFPEFPGVLSETDVVVFWTYELRAKETPTGQRFDGALLIPRRTP